MEFILIDGHEWTSLLPFTFIRPISYIRIGILTLKEKWDYLLGTATNIMTKAYLNHKYSLPFQDECYIFINPTVLPNHKLVHTIYLLKENQVLIYKKVLIAFCIKKKISINFKRIYYKLLHIHIH